MEKLAIDFDSFYTNIYKVGCGIVLSEPTVAAVSLDGKENLKAVGVEARKLIGKTADKTKIVFPVFEGEVVNEKVASKLLSSFLNKLEIKNKLFGVNAVFSIPCGSTYEMLKKYETMAKASGINKVHFIESPILSALGQRIPLTDSSPCFVIDMAGGTTSIAAVSLDGVIAGISVNFGWNKVTTDIIDYLADVYGLQVGLLTAERLKKEIGSLMSDDGLSTVINGRDILKGTPRSLSVKAVDIIEPVKQYYDKIAELAMGVLVKLPPEVSAEIRHAGLYVSGIGSQVYGLEKYYTDYFNMLINISDTGAMSVVLGGGIAIGNDEILNKLAIKLH